MERWKRNVFNRKILLQVFFFTQTQTFAYFAFYITLKTAISFNEVIAFEITIKLFTPPPPPRLHVLFTQPIFWYYRPSR